MFNEEALVHHQFLTERAASLSRFEKRREAVDMESVTARQELDGVSTGVEGFETNGAVVAGGIQSTPVGLEGRRFHANSALVAVRMVLGAADPTNAALVTVKLALPVAIGQRHLVIEENTDRAPVGAESDVTIIADRVGFLNQVASHALDRLDGVPVHRMRLLDVFFSLVVDLVVTKTATDGVTAAGGYEGGFPSVMGTTLIGC